MDCPNCHTYNPEDRMVCWRCDKPLPKVEPKKKKQVSSQTWLYILFALMLIMLVVNMCGLPRLFGGGTPPTSYLLPAALLG